LPFLLDPAPATLWTLTCDERLASCEVRFVPIGVKAKVMRGGKLLYARTFPNGDDALEWAEDERVDMVAKGWRLPLSAVE
jgi:hypothetical protein